MGILVYYRSPAIFACRKMWFNGSGRKVWWLGWERVRSDGWIIPITRLSDPHWISYRTPPYSWEWRWTKNKRFLRQAWVTGLESSPEYRQGQYLVDCYQNGTCLPGTPRIPCWMSSQRTWWSLRRGGAGRCCWCMSWRRHGQHTSPPTCPSSWTLPSDPTTTQEDQNNSWSQSL